MKRSLPCLALLGLLACDGASRAAREPSPTTPVSGPPTAIALAPRGAADGPPALASSGDLAERVDAPPPPDLAPPRDVRMPTEWLADLRWSGAERVAHAKVAKEETVRALFAQAGVSYPPKDVLFRAFKDVAELEVWAGDGTAPLALVATYGICAASGELGPKRREGDLQVPEGFYQIGYYHPTSAYYLAAQINYPNASDRRRGGPSPGGDILLHGRCASIGCISMTDERIEEIYLVGWAAFLQGAPTHFHIFPSRDFDALLADPKWSKHHDFWREIRVGFDAFEKDKRLPKVSIDAEGRYVVKSS
jgi:murein L,D-transpeptidase YafK